MEDSIDFECECGRAYEISHNPGAGVLMPKRFELLRLGLAWLNGQAELVSAVCKDLIGQTTQRGQELVEAEEEEWWDESYYEPAPNQQGLTR